MKIKIRQRERQEEKQKETKTEIKRVFAIVFTLLFAAKCLYGSTEEEVTDGEMAELKKPSLTEIENYAKSLNENLPRIYSNINTTPYLWSLFVRLSVYSGASDPKLIADSVSLYNSREILEKYSLVEKKIFRYNGEDKELHIKECMDQFYKENFYLPNINIENVLENVLENIKENENPNVQSKELPFKISEEKYVSLLQTIDILWEHLKRPAGDKKQAEGLSSIIFLDKPFIAPGGRFQECYYWDSYWINKGLILSGKTEASDNTKKNLIFLLQKYQFIPNGNREYYTNRSQPPFLLHTLMDSKQDIDRLRGKYRKAIKKKTVKEKTAEENTESFQDKQQINPQIGKKIEQPLIVNYSKSSKKSIFHQNISLTEEELNAADKNYTFWKKNRMVNVKADKNKKGRGEVYKLFQYAVKANTPRVEMLTEDIISNIRYAEAKNIQFKKSFLFREITSCTESGWDFSSRWREYNSSTGRYRFLCTTSVVPVDLNSIILSNIRILRKMYKEKGDYVKEQFYQIEDITLSRAMDAILWDEEQGRWRDAHLFESSIQKKNNKMAKKDKKMCIYTAKHRKDNAFYISDLYPLFMGIVKDEKNQILISNYNYIWPDNKDNNYLPYTSTVVSARSYETQKNSDQWDGGNIWPPLVQLLVEYLIRTNNMSLAKKTADSFIDAVNDVYKKNGYIPEKISVREKNTGEYPTQPGFGWTNGVVEWILYIFYSVIESEKKTQVKFNCNII